MMTLEACEVLSDIDLSTVNDTLDERSKAINTSVTLPVIFLRREVDIGTK